MAEGGVGISDVRRGQSPEYKALTKSYSVIVDCIARSPGDITDQLIPLGVLSKDEISDLRSSRLVREKARKIMDIVKDKVESMPSFLHKFISSIMDKEDWMKPYTDVLKATLKAEQQSDSIGANNFSTVEATRCTPAKTVTPLIPASDIFTSLSSQSIIESRIDTFDESDLENETDKIKKKFAVLVTCISRELKKKGVTTNDLTSLLSELGSVHSDHIEANQVCYFSNAFMQQIEEECKSDVGKVFPAIRKCYSWINFDLIESIKDTFLAHNKDIRKDWDKYQSHYKEYCKKRLCKIPKPINGTRILPKFLQKSTTVAFKIDSEWQEIRFDRLNSIQASIKRLLNLQHYTLYLKTVKRGCVELVFEVPQHVADVIFPPTEEQLLALQEHNIRYCGLITKAGSDTTEECTLSSSIDLSHPSFKKDDSEGDEGYCTWQISDAGRRTPREHVRIETNL